MQRLQSFPPSFGAWAFNAWVWVDAETLPSKGQVVEECFYLGIPQCDGKGIRTIGQARASFAIGMMASSTTCVGSHFLRGSLPAIQEMSPKGPK